jgi:hypothetical protein
LVAPIISELMPPVVVRETELSVTADALTVRPHSWLTFPPVSVAWILLVPAPTPVARPELLMVTFAVLLLAHPVTWVPWESGLLQLVVEPSE